MGNFTALCAIPSMLALAGAIVIFSGGKKRNGTQILLAVGLAIVSLGMCYPFVFRIPAFQNSYLTDWVLTTCSMLPIPIFYLYLCRLTGTGSSSVKSALFMPAILVSILNIILYLMMGHEGAARYFHQVTTTGSLGTDPQTIWVVKRVIGSYIYRAVIFISAVFVIVTSFRKVKAYHRDMEDYHANADEKYFRADSMTLLSYTFLTVAVLFYTMLSYDRYYDHPVYLIILSVSIGAGVSLLAYYGLKQNYTAEDLKKMGYGAGPSDGSVQKSELLRRLDNLRDTDVCCDSLITVVSLATYLGTDSATLNDLIGKRYGTSFSNFVNDIRIKRAIAMMREISANTPLTQVSRKCGYETYASFSRNFEQFAHTSPSEWMRKYRRNAL